MLQTLKGNWTRLRFDHKEGRYYEEKDPIPIETVIVGIRSDEEGSRSKEQYFSLRNDKAEWDVADQPPELWNLYNTEFEPNSQIRVHPLLDWTELNIWQYIYQEKIPVTPLYFNQGDGKRYRSLGCI